MGVRRRKGIGQAHIIADKVIKNGSSKGKVKYNGKKGTEIALTFSIKMVKV
ncbi:hypothetical protein [Saccharolobus islandicus]|uniref:Uncharacterized protein n=1 Tax=Saccharolobus islandicus (strain L.D.8.5 / Lassen \|nr:hypothetical protein [Sulfolobus islandicus]ADB86691.1 hypothetical protein LD85_0998 [Sulfolobus islandicus L.D.8.5]